MIRFIIEFFVPLGRKVCDMATVAQIMNKHPESVGPDNVHSRRGKKNAGVASGLTPDQEGEKPCRHRD